MLDVIKSLTNSRKALVLFASIAIVIALVLTKQIAGSQALDFAKWLVAAWFGAVAAEDAALKFAMPPPSPYSPTPVATPPSVGNVVITNTPPST